MIEGESEKEIKQGQSNHIDKETEIDLMDVLRKIIACLLYTSPSPRD